jgi:hypothetical protein
MNALKESNMNMIFQIDDSVSISNLSIPVKKFRRESSDIVIFPTTALKFFKSLEFYLFFIKITGFC